MRPFMTNRNCCWCVSGTDARSRLTGAAGGTGLGAAEVEAAAAAGWENPGRTTGTCSLQSKQIVLNSSPSWLHVAVSLVTQDLSKLAKRMILISTSIRGEIRSVHSAFILATLTRVNKPPLTRSTKFPFQVHAATTGLWQKGSRTASEILHEVTLPSWFFSLETERFTCVLLKSRQNPVHP